MERIIECVPNFSEGNDRGKVDAIVGAIKSEAVEVLDVQMNPDHNRAVISYIGAPESVLAAAFKATSKASQLIDLTKHRGEHPRIGATDVIPLVPVKNVTVEECVEFSRRLGKMIAQELKIPVFLYEAAATRPDRENLANIRKGEFEALAREIETNPDRRPDFGEPKIHPTAGAVVIGARFPLIAYNINLNTADVSIAKNIAKAIRFRDGGFRHVKALGFELKEENLVQVSINMTNYLQTPLYRVFETVRREAQRYGVNVRESEIVGLVPEKALIDTAVYFLQLNRFTDRQIMEYHLSGKACTDSLFDFLMSLADATPTPGGGSAAALSGAIGSALLAMVAGLSLKKSEEPGLKERLGFLKVATTELFNLIAADKNSFDEVMKSYRLPKDTDEEKNRRSAAVQTSLKAATSVPREVCRRILELYPHARYLLEKGLPSALSDIGVAAGALHSAFYGARLNVLINLATIKDRDFVDLCKKELDKSSHEEQKLNQEIENQMLTKLENQL